MSPHDQARAIYEAIKDDQIAIKIQRDNYKTLIAAMTGTSGGMQIQRAQINGQEFWAQRNSTDQEKLSILSRVMNMLKCGKSGRGSTLGRFL